MDDTSTLKVMSYNIRYDNPNDDKWLWKYRFDKVATIIQRYAPDIVGVQEALYNQMKDIENNISDYSWTGCGRDDGKQGGEYSAIFYKTAHLQLLESSTFWLSESPETAGSRSWNTACTRICTFAKFKIISSSKEFFAFNTHLDHSSRAAQTEGLKLILNKIEKIAVQLPVILMGDFNIEESDYLLDIITSLKNAKKIAKSTTIKDPSTFTGFTFHDEKIIDYFFVSENVNVTNYSVVGDVWEHNFPASDHRPITISIAPT